MMFEACRVWLNGLELTGPKTEIKIEPSFEETLVEYMVSAIEDPGVAAASTMFTLAGSSKNWPMTLAEVALMLDMPPEHPAVPGLCAASAY